MPRFFVDPATLQVGHTVLGGEQAAHAKVLRLTAGDEVTLCDGQGMEAKCVVTDFSNGQLSLDILAVEPSKAEPKLRCSIYMGFPKADKFEHVIQKATELGATEIIVFPCTRSISRPDAKSLAKKLERWQKIAASAAEQSGRGRIPRVLTLPNYAAALERAAQADKAILFYENEQATTLRMAMEQGSAKTFSLLTGPEGGLDIKEVEQAEKAGLQVCTLGKRILRCETAPLCALSAVMYASGEF